jgi:quercetin dioxygenase-like cupin family protein
LLLQIKERSSGLAIQGEDPFSSFSARYEGILMQKVDELKIPDITRLFKGSKNEFEVEIVFAEAGSVSPKESHPSLELIIVTDGTITFTRSDNKGDLENSCFS